MKIKKNLLIPILMFVFFVFLEIFLLHFFSPVSTSGSTMKQNFWNMSSIDTMKYSRDASSSDLSSDFIENQIKVIASTGATHVAIATPYDAQFLPRLTLWVNMARKYNLKVWFRGNFSEWEGWFGYKPDLTRAQHLQMTKNFILQNPDLFRDGDVFTACPECENGGPGDPRLTGDVKGFQQFMIDEYNTTNDAFKSINKNVTTNYDSMNGDVAKLVMDSPTTSAMGGIVAIDDYVSTPDKLVADVDAIAKISGGKVVLGEYGAPIPDINGNLTEQQQASFIKSALNKLAGDPNLAGLNYWVSFGGTTQLWNDDGTERLAVAVVKSFYNPQMFDGKVVDTNGYGVKGATVNYLNKTVITDKNGLFILPYADKNTQLIVSYKEDSISLSIDIASSSANTIVLPNTQQSLFDRFVNFFSK